MIGYLFEPSNSDTTATWGAIAEECGQVEVSSSYSSVPKTDSWLHFILFLLVIHRLFIIEEIFNEAGKIDHWNRYKIAAVGKIRHQWLCLHEQS